MIPSDSVDILVSNCVLNLVRQEDKRRLFGEMFRVLKRGGRIAVSDIVSDEEVPASMQNDPKLWSGCIAGAFREDKFIDPVYAERFCELLPDAELHWIEAAGHMLPNEEPAAVAQAILDFTR